MLEKTGGLYFMHLPCKQNVTALPSKLNWIEFQRQVQFTCTINLHFDYWICENAFNFIHLIHILLNYKYTNGVV
jgi:hypothetical protein